jgi:hypothetical protein
MSIHKLTSNKSLNHNINYESTTYTVSAAEGRGDATHGPSRRLPCSIVDQGVRGRRHPATPGRSLVWAFGGAAGNLQSPVSYSTFGDGNDWALTLGKGWHSLGRLVHMT